MILYNDIEPYPCQWLRNLIEAGHLPAGGVFEGSFEDIPLADIPPTFHSFCGIGGWPYALRLAGWPDDRPVWTASLPCQPLSSAGQRKGHVDERHLWPAFHDLIAECRPSVIFGEQVASKDGREWFAGIRADLEQLGYACGGADLPAASVGAPHIRQRLFWVAHDDQPGRSTEPNDGLQRAEFHDADGCGEGSGMGNAECAGLEKRSGIRRDHEPQRQAIERAGNGIGFWSDSALIPCGDGKARRIEPAIQPLAARLPESLDGNGPISRVGTLRAAGNAIVPQVAAEFIRAFMECEP